MPYQSRLTPVGLSKQSSFLSGGSSVSITHIALGDQNGSEAELTENQSNILNEVHRAAVSSVYTDPTNNLRKVAELVIPLEIGGFWVREAAIIDDDGDVIAIANLPPSFKAAPSSGAGRILTVRIGFSVSSSAAFSEMLIDGSAVYATRNYLDVALANLPDAWSDAEKLGGELPSHYATEAAVAAVQDEVDNLPAAWPDADKLGNQAPAYYASASSLNSLSDTVSAISGVPTGVEFGYWGNGAPAGYVLASGRTIGSASSGATERANADTEALFTLLWGAVGADVTLPIFTSAGGASTRGASAAADFAANKRMTLPDLRGRVGVGKDNMGNASAGRMTTADSGVDGVTIGAVGGSQTHTLTVAEIPSHWHATGVDTGGAPFNMADPHTVRPHGGSALTNKVPSTDVTGGGLAHNNTQPSIVRNVIIKL